MSGNEKVKVLIIDDSVLVRKYLSQILGELDNIEVLATAPNGKIGLQKIFMLKPDIVILDIEMPEMNGLELLKYLWDNVPAENRPFVIMFSSLVEEGSAETFEALSYGAEDFIKKPEGQVYENIDFLKKEFDIKIKALYETRIEKQIVIPEKEIYIKKEEQPVQPKEAVFYGIENLDKVLAKKPIRPELIAIGSSTGGPVAVRKIFDHLDNIKVPVVVAQHMPAGFTNEFAKNLSSIYKREVYELAEGNVLKKGVVYICPGGSHSKIIKLDGELIYKSDNNNYEGFFFRPSVDIFFRSIHEAVGRNVVAVILSGMGRDGSIESVILRRSGAIVIAQDKESSVVWGMPGNSVKNGGIDIVIDIKDIGTAINKISQRN